MDVEEAFSKCLAYCRANQWAGHDPYDALNSRIVATLPFLNTRIPRLILTQALKRSPVNLRRLLLIPKTQNPKALALFLSAFLPLSATVENLNRDIDGIIERLVALRSKGVSEWCWGYSFPWQTRSILVPVGAPNLVCTTFVADALLDAYENRRDPRYLAMAVSAAEYLVNHLYWECDESAGFAYPLPSVRIPVHNANFLAAALLCRVHRHTGDDRLLRPALASARHSAAQQRSNGSWYYGEATSQQWIDNFHTGFNLCALRSIARSTGITEFAASVRQGFDFYRNHFFYGNGAVRYFHNRSYPIDIHNVAQSIITLLTLEDLDPQNVPLAHSVFQWAIKHMSDESGFFYYRVLPLFKITTSYMRWSQAWMVLAMSRLICIAKPSKEPAHALRA